MNGSFSPCFFYPAVSPLAWSGPRADSDLQIGGPAPPTAFCGPAAPHRPLQATSPAAESESAGRLAAVQQGAPKVEAPEKSFSSFSRGV